MAVAHAPMIAGSVPYGYPAAVGGVQAYPGAYPHAVAAAYPGYPSGFMASSPAYHGPSIATV